MQVCGLEVDILHALPSADKVKVVIGAANVTRIKLPEFIGFVVVNFQVNFICISIFPSKGSTPGAAIVITPGTGIVVAGDVT